MDPEGRGLTQAGRIIGLVSMIIMILSVVMFVVMFAFMGVFAAAVPKPAHAPAPVIKTAPPAKNQFKQLDEQEP